MDQADRVHSTPRKTALKIIAGTDFVAQSPDANALDGESPPAQRKRKRRGPHRERHQIEYQDGLPVIDPAGELDPIFFEITRHRAAAAHHDRCVDVHQEAEGKVSADEFSHLQRNTRIAWDEMMLFARCVILCRPTTGRGLIHQVRYLVSQFNDLEGCQGGCMYFPDEIGERPWAMAFLQSLAAGLRKMAGELDPQNEGARL